VGERPGSTIRATEREKNGSRISPGMRIFFEIIISLRTRDRLRDLLTDWDRNAHVEYISRAAVRGGPLRRGSAGGGAHAFLDVNRGPQASDGKRADEAAFLLPLSATSSLRIGGRVGVAQGSAVVLGRAGERTRRQGTFALVQNGGDKERAPPPPVALMVFPGALSSGLCDPTILLFQDAGDRRRFVAQQVGRGWFSGEPKKLSAGMLIVGRAAAPGGERLIMGRGPSLSTVGVCRAWLPKGCPAEHNREIYGAAPFSPSGRRGICAAGTIAGVGGGTRAASSSILVFAGRRFPRVFTFHRRDLRRILVGPTPPSGRAGAVGQARRVLLQLSAQQHRHRPRPRCGGCLVAASQSALHCRRMALFGGRRRRIRRIDRPILDWGTARPASSRFFFFGDALAETGDHPAPSGFQRPMRDGDYSPE